MARLTSFFALLGCILSVSLVSSTVLQARPTDDSQPIRVKRQWGGNPGGWGGNGGGWGRQGGGWGGQGGNFQNQGSQYGNRENLRGNQRNYNCQTEGIDLLGLPISGYECKNSGSSNRLNAQQGGFQRNNFQQGGGGGGGGGLVGELARDFGK